VSDSFSNGDTIIYSVQNTVASRNCRVQQATREKSHTKVFLCVDDTIFQFDVSIEE